MAHVESVGDGLLEADTIHHAASRVISAPRDRHVDPSFVALVQEESSSSLFSPTGRGVLSRLFVSPQSVVARQGYRCTGRSENSVLATRSSFWRHHQELSRSTSPGFHLAMPNGGVHRCCLLSVGTRTKSLGCLSSVTHVGRFHELLLVCLP